VTGRARRCARTGPGERTSVFCADIRGRAPPDAGRARGGARTAALCSASAPPRILVQSTHWLRGRGGAMSPRRSGSARFIAASDADPRCKRRALKRAGRAEKDAWVFRWPLYPPWFIDGVGARPQRRVQTRKRSLREKGQGENIRGGDLPVALRDARPGPTRESAWSRPPRHTVAGQETAAIAHLADARVTDDGPPRNPFERGRVTGGPRRVPTRDDGRNIVLIARHGPELVPEVGSSTQRGRARHAGGAGRRPAVYETRSTPARGSDRRAGGLTGRRRRCRGWRRRARLGSRQGRWCGFR